MSKPCEQFYSEDAKNFDQANVPSGMLHKLVVRSGQTCADHHPATGADTTINYANIANMCVILHHTYGLLGFRRATR